MNLRGEKGGARDLLQDLDSPCVLDRRRAHAVGRRATRLDAHSRIRHRRRQPHLPHGDSRALARRAGGRRPARRQPPHSGRRLGHHRRRHRRRRHRSDAGDRQEAEARTRLQRGRQAAPTRRRTERDDRRRSHPAARQHRAKRRRVDGARVGRRRHRALSIGVSAGRRSAGPRRRGRAVRGLPARRREHGAAAGHDPHLRHRRTPARAAAGRHRARRALVRRHGADGACRAARHPLRPRAAVDLQDAAARAAAGRGARPAAHHVPVRLVGAGGARRAGAARGGARRARGARRRDGPPCRSAS